MDILLVPAAGLLVIAALSAIAWLLVRKKKLTVSFDFRVDDDLGDANDDDQTALKLLTANLEHLAALGDASLAAKKALSARVTAYPDGTWDFVREGNAEKAQ